MNEIERLTDEQLAELERLLADQKAPVTKRFRSSAAPEALAAVEEHLGRSLPDELRQWWEWHDGTDVEAHEQAIEMLIGPDFQFLSTNGAVQFSRQMRQLALEDTPNDPDKTWGSSWLALSNGAAIACDCACDQDAPVPILDFDYHKAVYPGVVVARSLGEMVRWWIEALESGGWTYDAESNWWKKDFELLPPERERTGLV